MSERGHARRHETPAERLDRNWGELLQEFRVAQTGIQVIFGFLLILPFQSGFGELSGRQQALYLVVFTCMTVSTICILAPVMAHRLLFRQRAKEQLVRFGSLLSKVSLGFLAAAFVCAVGLIVGFVAEAVMAWAAVGVAAVLILLLWVVLPLTVLRNRTED